MLYLIWSYLKFCSETVTSEKYSFGKGHIDPLQIIIEVVKKWKEFTPAFFLGCKSVGNHSGDGGYTRGCHISTEVIGGLWRTGS